MTTTEIRPAVPAPAGGVQRLTFAKAITAGLRRAMADDPSVMIMGEDVGRLGGVFRVTDGLHAEFGSTNGGFNDPVLGPVTFSGKSDVDVVLFGVNWRPGGWGGY